MALRNVDIEAGLRRLAERRIEEAMREGKFDGLEGAGKPIVLDDAPPQEDARLLWWALRILRQNGVIPDEIRWRKQVAIMKDELSRCRDEKRVQFLAGEINSLVRRLNTMGTTRLARVVTEVDEAEELARCAARRAGAA